MKQLTSNILERATLFTLTLSAWGNRAKGSLEDATFYSGGVDENPENHEPDKKRLSLSKRLIKSPEYKAIRTAQHELKAWCMERCMPSFLKDGIFIVDLKQVTEFEIELAKAKANIRDILVPAFITAYPAQVNESREALGNLFIESDYPSVEQLRHSFNLRWSWISFSIPDTLPPGIREQEIAKLKKQVQDAQIEIIATLRASAGDLVSHMIERLTPDASGKKKVIKDAFIDNFHDFFDTFDAKNLMDDTELAETVGRARALLENVSADGLRGSADLRQNILNSFENIKTETDKLIEEMPSRMFDFDEEEG
jgi:hypothetical protein